MTHKGIACNSSRQACNAYLALSAFSIIFLMLLASSAFSQSTSVDIIPDTAVTGSVELTPAYISGDVRLGGQGINRIQLDAESSEFLAKTTLSVEGAYSLTVNVPKGESLEYTVSGMAYMDSWSTRMYFKDRSTFVKEGQTSLVNFIVDPGYVAVDIETTCSLTRSDIEAFLDNGSAYTNVKTRKGSESYFRFPVQPNSNISVSGQVQLSTGNTVALQSRHINVLPGSETRVTWQINCTAGMLGAIQHDVNYHMPLDYNFTYLYEQNSYTYSRYARHNGSHVFDNIGPGTWRLYTYSYWNNGRNYIAKDLRDVTVSAGEIAYAPIDEEPGFLNGTVTLTGTKTVQDTYSAYINAYGRNPLYPSYRSYSRSAIEGDGSYSLALPQGEWNYYITNFRFYNPSLGQDFLNAYLYMYDYAKYNSTVFIDKNQTITGQDINYETGSATIKYSIASGGTFTSPYLYARCYNRDENNRLTSYIYAIAYGNADSETVTFVGMPGTYEVDAWARVDGSVTTFGKVTVEIVAGVDKVVDLGGPELTVTSPEPGSIFEENLIMVVGTVTDDIRVERVTVNGVEAAFEPTNNPEDPREVSFDAALILAEGENTIETVAEDASGNQSKDSRTVTYEVPEPETVFAGIDIKPGSCKNPFNVKAMGVLPVVILGSDSFDVMSIDPSSILLAGVAPLRNSFEDVTGSDCEFEEPDGYYDLTLKFDRQEILEVLGEVNDGDVFTLTMTGFLYDGTEFSGDDDITVLVRGKKRR